MNREEYLLAAVDHLAPIFKREGYTLPAVNVSCSWPGGGSARKRIGECWPRRASASKANEIYISPVIADSVRALDILAHELCHAVDDCKNGHRAPFTKIARSIGLEGKPTATIAGADLEKELQGIVSKLGDYPHKAMTPVRPKQSTRMLKITCDDCGAIWRMSKKYADQVTSCPVCQSESIKLDV